MKKREGKRYREPISALLNRLKPRTILDLACGSGWLRNSIGFNATIHGTDLYSPAPEGYDRFIKADLNHGVPDDFDHYDAIVCCEAMPYLQNPGLFLESVRHHLKSAGVFIASQPNPTYVGARLNYLIQGYPRSYSHFVQNTIPEPHMPRLSLGLFQLWHLLGLNGFREIFVHEVEEEKPKHLWELPFGLLSKLYCRSRLVKSNSAEERTLWSQARSNQVIYGRQLVISATAK